ncbi:hypothetical protein BSL78_16373 [Apostichopus japonicus]|uniref:Uncharacterized protein n=1 Tax=Stichopus japonicus TaxID=307972 RepID=A0A2G8KFN2_STIJA|nr:hypothetical protein BSL78_16373 [Apostichopus japonicus]
MYLGSSTCQDSSAKKEAAKHIESVHQNTCSMVIKKGRFYRLAKDYTKALEVLMKGESEFSSPRSELFFQTSLVYEALAKLPRVDQTTKKNNLEKHIAYCNKCLELEPQHFPALLKKARALGQLKRNDAAEKVFREAMRVVKARPKNFVQVQYWFAEHLTFRNRKQVTPEAAELYQGAMSTTLSMIQNADDFAIDDIKESMKWFVTNSKKKLDEFYQGNPSSNIVHIERMFASFHF